MTTLSPSIADLLLEFKPRPRRKRRAPATAARLPKALREHLTAWARAIANLVRDARKVAAKPKPPKLHPAVVAVLASAEVARLIGKPEAARSPEVDSWVELDESGTFPKLRLWWRGSAIAGERIGTEYRQTQRGERVVRCRRSTGHHRDFCLEALTEAMAAAARALTAAKIPLAAHREVRRVRVGQVDGGVAVIALKPVLARRRGPALAR